MDDALKKEVVEGARELERVLWPTVEEVTAALKNFKV